MNWEPAKKNWRTISAVAWALSALLLSGWLLQVPYREIPVGRTLIVVDIRSGHVYRSYWDLRSAFVQRMAQAKVDGDNEAFRQAMADWRAYNADRTPDRHIVITADDIRAKVRAIRMNSRFPNIDPFVERSLKALLAASIPLGLLLLPALLAVPALLVWVVVTLARGGPTTHDPLPRP